MVTGAVWWADSGLSSIRQIHGFPISFHLLRNILTFYYPFKFSSEFMFFLSDILFYDPLLSTLHLSIFCVHLVLCYIFYFLVKRVHSVWHWNGISNTNDGAYYGYWYQGHFMKKQRSCTYLTNLSLFYFLRNWNSLLYCWLHPDEKWLNWCIYGSMAWTSLHIGSGPGLGTVNLFHHIYLCAVWLMSSCKLFVNLALVWKYRKGECQG